MNTVGRKKQEKGQGMVEYALILVLVAVVVIAAVTALGPRVSSVFTSVNSNLASVSVGGGGAGSPASAPAAPTAAPSPTPNLGTCYLRWTGTQWVHWYDNTPEVPGVCP